MISIKVNDVEVFGCDDNKYTYSAKKDIRIAILQRGWVFIGIWNPINEEEVALENAYCIRRWGTEHGIGQLAREGMLSETVLDKVKDKIIFHKLSCILSIPCEEEKWKTLI